VLASGRISEEATTELKGKPQPATQLEELLCFFGAYGVKEMQFSDDNLKKIPAEELSNRFEKIQNLADNGHAFIQYILGAMHLYGCGIHKDYGLAVKYFQMSADQFHPQGQNNLGYMYEDGNGIKQDFEMSLNYYKLSADQGYSAAQNNIGYMYRNGKGVTRDNEIALKYYMLAADQGEPTALYNIGMMYEKARGVKQDKLIALKYFQMAANQGDTDAQKKVEDLLVYQHRWNTQKILWLGHLQSSQWGPLADIPSDVIAIHLVQYCIE